jgi:hypothetical protein
MAGPPPVAAARPDLPAPAGPGLPVHQVIPVGPPAVGGEATVRGSAQVPGPPPQPPATLSPDIAQGRIVAVARMSDPRGTEAPTGYGPGAEAPPGAGPGPSSVFGPGDIPGPSSVLGPSDMSDPAADGAPAVAFGYFTATGGQPLPQPATSPFTARPSATPAGDPGPRRPETDHGDTDLDRPAARADRPPGPGTPPPADPEVWWFAVTRPAADAPAGSGAPAAASAPERSEPAAASMPERSDPAADEPVSPAGADVAPQPAVATHGRAAMPDPGTEHDQDTGTGGGAVTASGGWPDDVV